MPGMLAHRWQARDEVRDLGNLRHPLVDAGERVGLVVDHHKQAQLVQRRNTFWCHGAARCNTQCDLSSRHQMSGKETMSLQGQTALVTGAGRRIGESIRLALGEQRVNVIIHYRHSVAPAQSLRESLVARGLKAFCVKADFDLPEAADSLIERARAEAGPIQILINSASEFHPQPLSEMTHTSLLHDVTVNAC